MSNVCCSCPGRKMAVKPVEVQTAGKKTQVLFQVAIQLNQKSLEGVLRGKELVESCFQVAMATDNQSTKIER